MQIKYADILEIYKNYTKPEDDGSLRFENLFICYALKEEFGDDMDTKQVMRAIAIDSYGPILGRVQIFFSAWRSPTLEGMFPKLGDKLGIVWCGPKVVSYMEHTNDYKSRVEFRINVLTKLDKKCPNRTFDVEFF